MHPVASITVSRLREFIRRPEAVFWVYFFPVLMVVVLGVAFRNKTTETFPVDIIAGDDANDIFKQLEPESSIVATIVTPNESRQRLRTGKSVLAISTGPTEDSPSRGPTIDYQFDPDRPGALTARNLVDQQLQTARGRQDVFTASESVFDEPGGTYVDFLVPGLLAMGLMGGGMWGVGYAIVDMRIRKLLKRFMATPMKRTHFLFSMLLSRLVFMIPQIIILIGFSYFLFDVRIYGSIWAVVLLVIIGAFEFASIGLAVGSRAQTLETASGLMNFVMLPMWTLCGIFFPYQRFPEVFHPFIRCLPLTPIIDSLRAVMMDGKSIFTQWPEITVMLFWCIVPFVIAMTIFRWRD